MFSFECQNLPFKSEEFGGCEGDRKTLRNEEVGTPASSYQSETKIRLSDIKSSGKIRIDPQNLNDTVFKG